MKPGHAPAVRRQPVRTCIGCRTAEGKRGLERIVRAIDGTVAVDPTGKANGRGAYLHPRPSCWEQALKRGTINHTLKTTMANEHVEALRAFVATLPREESEPE